MNRYLRSLAIIFAGSLLAFLGVANGQRSGNNTETPQVTWKDAPGRIAAPSASAGAQVVKDADTGRLRQARPGELPEAPIVAQRRSSTTRTGQRSPSWAMT